MVLNCLAVRLTRHSCNSRIYVHCKVGWACFGVDSCCLDIHICHPASHQTQVHYLVLHVYLHNWWWRMLTYPCLKEPHKLDHVFVWSISLVSRFIAAPTDHVFIAEGVTCLFSIASIMWFSVGFFLSSVVVACHDRLVTVGAILWARKKNIHPCNVNTKLT